jgi:integrase
MGIKQALEKRMLDQFVADNLRDIVLCFNYSAEKKHLTVDEFSNILEVLDYAKLEYFQNKSVNMKKHINGYQETVTRFNTLNEWEQASYKQKILVNEHKHSNILYYFSMVILGRISCDFEILSLYNTNISCLRKNEIALITEILEKSADKDTKLALRAVKNILNCIILYHRRYIWEISELDLLNFFECYNNNKSYLKTTFEILQELNLIDKNLIYRYLIRKDDIEKVKSSLSSLGHEVKQWQRIVTVLNKIVGQTGRYIYDISEDDFYNLVKNSTVKVSYAKTTFYVLKCLGVFENNSKFTNPFKEKFNYSDHVNNNNKEVLDTFHKYVNYTKKTMYKKTSPKHEHEARVFLNWIWDEYGEEINTFNKFTFDLLSDYALWQKCKVNPKTQKVYSVPTVNGKLSRLKHFLFYLLETNKLSNEWIGILHGQDAKFNNLFYADRNKLPEPIPIEDRRKIEEIIYSIDDLRYFREKRMFKLLYLFGMRPSELLALKLNCIVGTRELPQLYIHRAKGFKERYVPLTQEGLAVIKEMQQINNDSPTVYNEYDDQTCQRLFHEKGEVKSQVTLNNIFKMLQVENGLVSLEGEAKYTLYVLRRIRITTWLEAGISEYEVAELVGHDDVDSHNSYIVSKEKRTQNAKKVYDNYYKDFVEEIIETGRYTEQGDKEKENKEYIEKLKDTLMRIDLKTINKMVLEEIYNDFPEYAIPLPCGNCLGKVLYKHDFECEGMSLPCLECEELGVDEKDIQTFDEFVGKVYLNLSKREKAKLEGLVERSNILVERLKKFYIAKFKYNLCEVEEHFNMIKKASIPRKGRKKLV